MAKNVTVVMYHYVRDLNRSRYPKIKGLTTEKFIEQLDYLEENYSVVRMEDFIAQIEGDNGDFPENAALLTFDDGYIEHFTEVFPVLDERGLQGAFFPPVQSTMEGKVLDVNKIHFILATSENPTKLLDVLAVEIKNLQSKYSLETPEFYYDKIGAAEHPYDPVEIIKFKRVLQRELPYEARKVIVSNLFDEFVGIREDVFSEELYMNEDQLKTLVRCGMFVGGHGYSHKWLNAISADEQKFEIDQTKQFLEHIGVGSESHVMCYPYGGYDKSLINGLKMNGFVAGLTTVPQKAKLSSEYKYELGRYDTNEIG